MIPSSRQTFIASIGLFILTSALSFHFHRWNFDDGEIVYRVVRNITTLGEWSYNRGEAFNPSTSALNTIFIALFSLTGLTIPYAGHLVGALSLFALSLGIFVSLRKFSSSWSALLVSALCVWLLSHSSVWGLETFLFLALLSWITPLRDKPIAPWILLGLLPLARPDGLVVVAAYLIWYVVTKRKIPWLGSVIVGLILLPWVSFSMYSFGQPFPDTLSVKMWQGRSGLWGQGRVYLKGLISHLSSTREILLSLMALCSLVVVRYSFNALAFLLIFAIIQQGAYIVLNVPFYHWYVVSFDLARWALAGIWLAWMISLALSKFRSKQAEVLSLSAIITLILGASAVVLMRTPPTDPRDEGYRIATDAVKRVAPAAPLVAAVEVGTIGYELDTQILDLAGLASKNPELVSGQHTDYFFQRLPDVVLLHNPLWHFESAVFDDVRFEAMYEEVARTNHFAFPMTIYKKRTEVASTGSNLADYVDRNFPKASSIALDSPPSSDPKTACIFDRVNGKATQPGMALTTKPLLLAVSGWSALLDQSEPLGSLEVVLRNNADGSAYSSVQSERLSREDVAKHLGVVGQNNSGFALKVAITGVPNGDYSVLTRQRDNNGNDRWCGPVVTLLIRE